MLKVSGHTLVNNRIFDISQTPNPVPMVTYIWDIYDISAPPGHYAAEFDGVWP